MKGLTLQRNDPENAIQAIREAALRLKQKGMSLWSQDELTQEELSIKYPDCEYISFHTDENLVGGVILYKNRPSYWPNEIPDKPAIYISKLSVTNLFIGRNISSLMLREIEALYKGQVQYVRLDCTSERPKLNAVYTNYGFKLIHHSVVAGIYPTNFYEKLI